MGIQEAINAKKTHSQWLPDTLFIENRGISSEVQLELKTNDHLRKVQANKCSLVLKSEN